MNDLFSLAGKNILITGSAQGIGFLLATGLGKYGAQIIINDITAERAELAVEKLHQEGIQAVAAPFNVTHKGNDSNLLIVFYVQIMPDDFVMQLHRF